jgi:hypothetical protein
MLSNTLNALLTSPLSLPPIPSTPPPISALPQLQLITLLLLLFAWIHLDNRLLYKWYLGGMLYISDVGAVHKAFFRWGCTITAWF